MFRALALLLCGCGAREPGVPPPSACDGPLADAAPPTDLAALEQALEAARTVVPELDGVSIALAPGDSESDFFYSNLELATLNDPPRDRAYLTYYGPALFDDPPSGAATVAILVHELSHVRDYTGMDGPTLAAFGVWYATEDVAGYEHSTDLFAMVRGCAPGLVEYREWLYAHVTPEVEAEKRHDYATPEELRAWLAAR